MMRAVSARAEPPPRENADTGWRWWLMYTDLEAHHRERQREHQFLREQCRELQLDYRHAVGKLWELHRRLRYAHSRSGGTERRTPSVRLVQIVGRRAYATWRIPPVVGACDTGLVWAKRCRCDRRATPLPV